VDAALTTPQHVESRASVPAYDARTVWIAIRLLLVYYLGQQGSLFFYQVF
jgi:hypothetical protein